MVKVVSILIVGGLLPYVSLTQKPIVDILAVEKWPSIRSASAIISNNGKFFIYTGQEGYAESALTVTSTDNTLMKKFPLVTSAFFSGDSKQVIFKRNDSLFFFGVESEEFSYVDGVVAYGQPKGNAGIWLGYQIRGDKQEFVLRNLLAGSERRFSSVSDFKFDDNGNVLLLKRTLNQDSVSRDLLQLVDLQKEQLKVLWAGSFGSKGRIMGFNFDASGKQSVFVVQNSNDTETSNEIWYHSSGMGNPVLMADVKSAGIDTQSTISEDLPYFSFNGRFIFFSIKSKFNETLKSGDDAAKVDIWSYRDSVLQSAQLMEGTFLVPKKTSFLSAIRIADKHIVRLEYTDERVLLSEVSTTDFVVLQNKVSILEPWWRNFDQKSYSLVGLSDGSRKPIGGGNLSFWFSPGGKYLIYYDNNKRNYFSYELSTNALVNISKAVNTSLAENNDRGCDCSFPIGIGGWLSGDSAVFVYDQFDIWQLNLTDKKAPTNITNGYGFKNRVELRFVTEAEPAVYSRRNKLLLVGFSSPTKRNGFYSASLQAIADPQLLSMESLHTYTHPSQAPIAFTLRPVKAKLADKWIVKRQSASLAPNFYVTTDFKRFRMLTDLQPQKKFNWLSSELINWRQHDGSSSQGILYKPENFDPQKKYPIIFTYYEKESYRLNEFLQPELSSSCEINIPWFVSRGYLVFTPDIFYKLGKTGESVVNSVVSAAEYLAQMTWVDSSKMAIAGQSFGGFETNYLITHSKIFAAAASSAGASNFVSGYGGIAYMDGGSTQRDFEYNQYRVGSSFSERPDLYFDNSPVFRLNKVSTPLLIMHNVKDPLVPWSQGVEFYTGLRRLERAVWMLQYDDGSHSISSEKDKKDFTIRISQFLDHYLKGYPPPKWMTQGRPAKLKGIDDRLELDPGGSCGDSCKICREKKYQNLEILDVMNPNTIKYKVDAKMNVVKDRR